MTDIKYELEDAVEFFNQKLGKRLPQPDWRAAIAKFPEGQLDCHRLMYAGLQAGQFFAETYRRPDNGAPKTVEDFLNQTFAQYASSLYHNAKCGVKHTPPPSRDILKPVLNLSIDGKTIEIAKSSTLHDEDNRRSVAKRTGYILAKVHSASMLEEFATLPAQEAIEFVQTTLKGYLANNV